MSYYVCGLVIPFSVLVVAGVHAEDGALQLGGGRGAGSESITYVHSKSQ